MYSRNRLSMRNPRNRYPTVTLVSMAAAGLVTLGIVLIGSLIEDSGPLGLIIFAPSVLGMFGAGAAMFYRSLSLNKRLLWAASSAIFGFGALWAAWMLAIAVEAVAQG